MRNWFSKVGRLVALKQKTEHHSDFGFSQPSHPFALERIFHSHKCRTSKATSGSMKIVGNFENFWSPAIMGGSQPKRFTCSCAFQTQALRLSLSDARIMKNPAAAWGPTRSAARAVLTLVLSQCERPDCSGTETGSTVEYRTSTDPTFDRTMRFPPNRHNTTSWFLRKKTKERESSINPKFNCIYDEKHQPNPRFPPNQHNETSRFLRWKQYKKKQ